jgi:hypothetical protein
VNHVTYSEDYVTITAMKRHTFVSKNLIITFKSFQIYKHNSNKIKIMGNLLYVIAVIFLIAWAIGYFAFSVGGVIHILLIIAVIAVLFRIISGRKILD